MSVNDHAAHYGPLLGSHFAIHKSELPSALCLQSCHVSTITLSLLCICLCRIGCVFQWIFFFFFG